MDEERLRMRRELMQRARRQKTSIYRRQNQTASGKQLFLFRTYVTMMLVGTAIVLSFFHTETTNDITNSLKEAIAYEISLDTIEQWKEKAVTVFEQTVEKKENTTDIQSQQTTQQQESKTNAFEPDLNEKSGEIP